MKTIKTKINYKIPLDLIIISTILIIVSVFSESILTSSLGKIFITFLSFSLLFGLWKIEYYQLDANILKKYHFIGLIPFSYDLKQISNYQKKNYDVDFYYLLFSGFFTKSKNYKNIRKIKLYFSDGRKVTVYENSLENRTEINLIISQIKKYKSKEN